MRQPDRLRRKHKKAPSGIQKELGFLIDCSGERVYPEGVTRAAPVPVFEEPDSFTMILNGMRLTDYLTVSHQEWIIQLMQVMRTTDWSLFFPSYRPTGRRPIHPRTVMSLLIYGLLLGRTSLRELELLAKLDLGAWFLCGGLQPDHSTIGKFVHRHSEILTQRFFDQLTADLVARLKLTNGLVAIDGTVVAAASSRLSTIKLEAAREASREATELAARLEKASQNSAAPDSGLSESTETPNSELAAARQQAAAAAHVVQVAEARASKSDHPERTSIVPGEPEAVIQPLKNGPYHPSYKPSVLVHESGLIIGQVVSPSSETAVIPDMRAQYQRIFGAAPSATLCDAGYNCFEVLHDYVRDGEDILCPSGTRKGDFKKQGKAGLYGKTAFTFDEAMNQYRCPQGHTLAVLGKNRDREGRVYVTYRADAAQCATCPFKSRCTKSSARTISRYEGDELKEAMAQVMEQTAARKLFKRRATIVEPIFACLKERQNLKRFRRRGLTNAQLEFSLHCIAFNIRCGLSLERRRVVVFVLSIRIDDSSWHMVSIATAIQ